MFRLSERSIDKQSNKTYPQNIREPDTPPRISNFTSIPTSKRILPDKIIRYETSPTRKSYDTFSINKNTEKNNNHQNSEITRDSVICSVAQCDECPE